MAFATDINIHHGANFSAMRTNTGETNAAFKHGAVRAAGHGSD
jgi:hypothetical protein